MSMPFPSADVVVVAHSGLDPFPTFALLARAVPLTGHIRVTAWRTAAADLPADREGRIAWLDGQWLRLDDWCERAS